MAYIRSTGTRKRLALAVLGLLAQPVLAQQDVVPDQPVPLVLEHDVRTQPFVPQPDNKRFPAEGPPANEATGGQWPPQRPDLMFGGYRDWEVGVDTRRSVGVMIRRDFR